ncbi:FAD/NAD(P)-binding protein [Hymenobacter sp. ASUV-10]|uniref:FAD/NAD(P)-binding protein n=1 Tax=Hymenobacter aranciens TaxID=3063996 RepID=A0ABT9BG22_9BACT|nr:FAD/NAD(P)-binding protein [Hymenobacter sp. ASUV-10]MDO7877202.1 FAD/NAD(P)-binding protein [Hymenobacter sp. ASUV-10]
MNKTATHPVITIVGAGFAGTALALQLRRELPQAVIHLVEPRPVPGPGLAYSGQRPEHLLNVRPRSLSLYADLPEHFAEWLRGQPEAAPALPEFATRATYGRYLLEELGAGLMASQKAEAGVHWYPTTAVATSATANGRVVELADGNAIHSQFVVLALGNFPPPPPVGSGTGYLKHPAYHAAPWNPDTLSNIGAAESVILIGSGLTAVDVLLTLRRQGHRAPVAVVARHGRWPAAHGPAEATYPDFYPELAAKTNVADTLAVLRQHLRQAAAQGIDWRPVLDSLRPHLGRIWANWPLAEQRRFLRHLAGRWSVARHRSPPQNAAAIAEMLANGQVQLHIGRISEIKPDSDRLQVCVQHGPAAGQWLAAQHVICCTGPLLDYSRIDTPLVRSLRETGELTPDLLGLGLQTDAHGALLATDGQPSPTLFTLGPSRRPAYFESTAVPEIRQQAAALAAELARRATENR